MYGYDQFTPEENSYDDYFYVETTKPLYLKESFDNHAEFLVDQDDTAEDLKKKFSRCASVNHQLKHRCDRLQKIVKDSYDEFLELQTHTYILYMLIFIAVIIIVNQKINIDNLRHCLDILKLQNRRGLDLNAPIAV